MSILSYLKIGGALILLGIAGYFYINYHRMQTKIAAQKVEIAGLQEGQRILKSEMKQLLLSCFIYCSFLIPFNLHAQGQWENILDSVFKERGEVYFRFSVNSKSEINELTKIISIDNVKGFEVTAYANRNEFKLFLDRNYPYKILPPPSTLVKESELNMGGANKDREARTIWNFYPTYQQYVDFMTGLIPSPNEELSISPSSKNTNFLVL